MGSTFNPAERVQYSNSPHQYTGYEQQTKYNIEILIKRANM